RPTPSIPCALARPALHSFPTRRSSDLLFQHTGISSQTEGSSDIFHAVLFRHKIDHRVHGVRIQFCAVCVLKTGYISGKFYNSHLHAQTDSQEWNLVFPGIFYSLDLSFRSSMSKASRDQDSVYPFQKRLAALSLDFFRVYPADVYIYPAGDTAVF